MSAPSPDQFRGWLFARVIEQACFEAVPRDKAMATIKDLVKNSYHDGEFNSNPMVAWFKTDFAIPEEDLDAFTCRLQEEGKSVGVNVLLPHEAPPKVVFASGQDPELPERAEETPAAKASPAAAVSPPPNATNALLAAASAMKAAANAKAGAKPLAKINPVPSPAPEPPAFDPVESVTNYKFLETCILEYANTGGKGLPDLVSKTIQKLMQLTDTEQSLIKNSAPDPGGASESVAGWVLRLNGLALGMGLAKAVVVTKTKHDHQAWHKAVRQIEKHFGSQVTRIMVRQSEAKKKEPEQAEVLNDASHRANRLHDELERLTRDTPRHPASESIDPHEETNEPPPKEKGGLLRGLFKKSGP